MMLFGILTVLCFPATVWGLVASKDACLQIYSVPKQSVVCEPSAEVMEHIGGIQTALDVQTESLGAMASRIDALDPDKPRELPEEVREKLNAIDGIEMTQNNHEVTMTGFEAQVAALVARMVSLEDSNRDEFSRMIQMQTDLIAAMWQHSNATLHEEYIDKLNYSVSHFLVQLRSMELGIRDSLESKESQILRQLAEATRIGRLELNVTQLHYRELLTQLGTRLADEQEKSRHHMNVTESQGEVMENTRLTSENLLLRQKLSEEHLTGVLEELTEVREQLHKETEDKEQIQTALEALQVQYNLVTEESLVCMNTMTAIDEKIKTVTSVVDRWQHVTPRALKVHDCSDALRFYYPVSGVYSINPAPALQPYDVYCDMSEGDAGWTVIHHRKDGSLDFFRGWDDYREGFGDAEGEYWLGLQKVHVLSTTKSYKLRIDMEDWTGRWWYAQYDTFSVGDEKSNYTLHVTGYQGDAGDSLSYHDGMPFTTLDRNNDKKDGLCATWCHGAWWYKDCFLSNLNGRYYKRGPYIPDTNWGDGVNWKTTFNTYYYSLKTASMKIKPIDE